MIAEENDKVIAKERTSAIRNLLKENISKDLFLRLKYSEEEIAEAEETLLQIHVHIVFLHFFNVICPVGVLCKKVDWHHINATLRYILYIWAEEA